MSERPRLEYRISSTLLQPPDREHTVLLSCLYFVADRLLALIKKVVFRAAFAGFIVVEFVAFVLLLWAVSGIIPDPNYFLLGILIALILSGPFLIGACSYLVFKQMTRVEYILTESERWLAERHDRNPRRIKRRKLLRRWAVWIPAVSVFLAVLFLDQTWAIASHLFHPGSGRLIGYRVSVPLNWTVDLGVPYLTKDQTWSLVSAKKISGALRAGWEVYLGRKPGLVISEMAFYGASGMQVETNRHSPFGNYDALISSRTSTFGKGTITCSDYASPYERVSGFREISCFTPKGDFSCFFSGDETDVPQFYRTLQSVIPTD